MQKRMQRPSAADAESRLPVRPVAFAVLAALAEGPLPGFGILEAVNATVPGSRLFGPGTLYRLLRELRQQRLIARTDPGAGSRDDRQVHHELTALGAAVLRAEGARLRRTLDLATRARPATVR
jgi:DNA-binding PadR family transcriptional regulator